MNQIMNFRPTDSQLSLIARIASSPTPELAYEEAQNGSKNVESFKILLDLGLVYVSNSGVGMSDAGLIVATNFNVIDEMGNLTDYGNQLKGVQDDTPLSEPPPTTESFELIRILNRKIKR